MSGRPTIRQLEEILDAEGRNAIALAPDGTVIRTRDLTNWSKGMEDAALLLEEMASENTRKAAELHRKSNEQARLGRDDAADQTKISAQVLDECAAECLAGAAKVRERITFIAPPLPAKDIEHE